MSQIALLDIGEFGSRNSRRYERCSC